jgi:hypothetical protein
MDNLGDKKHMNAPPGAHTQAQFWSHREDAALINNNMMEARHLVDEAPCGLAVRNEFEAENEDPLPTIPAVDPGSLKEETRMPEFIEQVCHSSLQLQKPSVLTV